MAPNSQFPRLKISPSSGIIFLLGLTLFYMLSRDNPEGIAYLLSKVQVFFWDWSPPWHGPNEDQTRQKPGFKPGLKLLTQTENLIKCQDFFDAYVLSHFNHVWLFASPWTVAWQAPLSMRFSRQEYWSGLPCPPLWDLSHPGIKPTSLMSPVLTGRFVTTSTIQGHAVTPYLVASEYFLSLTW